MPSSSLRSMWLLSGWSTQLVLVEVRCAVRLSETNRREQKQARRQLVRFEWHSSPKSWSNAGQKVVKSWSNAGQKVVILGGFLHSSHGLKALPKGRAFFKASFFLPAKDSGRSRKVNCHPVNFYLGFSHRLLEYPYGVLRRVTGVLRVESPPRMRSGACSAGVCRWLCAMHPYLPRVSR